MCLGLVKQIVRRFFSKTAVSIYGKDFHSLADWEHATRTIKGKCVLELYPEDTSIKDVPIEEFKLIRPTKKWTKIARPKGNREVD